MQGMPANILTKNAPATKAVVATKGDAKTPVTSVNAEGVQVQSPAANGEAAKAESKNSFASLFSGLIGQEATKVEGKGEKVEKLPKEMAEEAKAQASAESKMDALLKTQGKDQNKKSENTVMTKEQALSPEVMKNIDSLLVKTPVQATAGTKGEVSEKIAATSTNLDQLLKTLKGQNGEVPVQEGEEVVDPSKTQEAKSNKGSALDFLLKQSKESDVGAVEVKDTKLLKTNPEAVSKLGLSSEDFISHANAKVTKTPVQAKTSILEGEAFDPKDLLQKQVNASMKSYGQKQNLLNDNLIRNTNDLAFKETKPKSKNDELTNPDMKIGADLSLVKESFVPMMNNKHEANQPQTENAGKVLDLSKMNTTNSSEIIKRISDYVQQNQVANQNSLDLTVKHETLGQFKIQVNKPMDPRATHMDMQITTTTAEGHDFFVKNEIGLMKNLSQAGIQLSDLRIVSGGESSSFAQNDSRQSGHNSQHAPREFMSFENGDSSQGSDRRRELWQEARANQQRYGA